jgi:hypothetical protein
MLRRKHKKMRKKRGGSGFFDKFKSGFDTVKFGIGKGITKTQEGISNAKIAAKQTKSTYDAEINKAREGGEKDAVLGWDYDDFEDKEFRQYTSPFARNNNSKGHEFSRNSYSKPNRKPILPSIPKKEEENYKSEKEIFIGGRKRKTKRRRGGKRKTRRKKKRKSRRKSRRKSHKSRRRR